MVKNREALNTLGESAKIAKRLLQSRGVKIAAGTMGLLATAGVLSACGSDGVPTHSLSVTAEAPVPPSATHGETTSPSPEAKIYDQLIEQIDPQDYVIEASDSYTADELAKLLIDRQDEIETIFNSEEGLDAASAWHRDKAEETGTSPDKAMFRRQQMEKVADKLRNTYYASTIDRDADTGSLDNITDIGYAMYSIYTAGMADGIEYTVDTTIQSAGMRINDDGTYTVEAVVYTLTNVSEIDSSTGNDKTERYTFHLTNENGEVRVISVTRDVLS